MDVGFARDLYFREFEAKAQQDARISVHVALLSAVGGVLAFLIRSAWPGQTPWCRASLVSSFVSVVPYFLAIVWALRGTVGFTYEKLPSPDNLLAYSKGLARYYRENPGISGSASADFEDFLVRHFSSAATRNGRNNLARSARFYRAGQFLLWVVVLSAIAGLCLALNQVLPVLVSRGA